MSSNGVRQPGMRAVPFSAWEERCLPLNCSGQCSVRDDRPAVRLVAAGDPFPRLKAVISCTRCRDRSRRREHDRVPMCRSNFRLSTPKPGSAYAPGSDESRRYVVEEFSPSLGLRCFATNTAVSAGPTSTPMPWKPPASRVTDIGDAFDAGRSAVDPQPRTAAGRNTYDTEGIPL